MNQSKNPAEKGLIELQIFDKYPNVRNYGQFLKICEMIRVWALD